MIHTTRRLISLGNKARIALHVHSNKSPDGTSKRKQIIKELEKEGKPKEAKVLAFTDHDIIAPRHKDIIRAQKHRIELLSGTGEFSVNFPTKNGKIKMHFTIYFVEPSGKSKIYELRNKGYEMRREQVMETLANLKRIGFDVSEIQITERNYATIRKIDIAKKLFESKIPQNVKLISRLGIKNPYQLRELFLIDSSPLTKYNINAEEFIKIVKQHGGHVVVSHPGLQEHKISEEILHQLIEMGVEGIEVIHPGHDGLQTRRLIWFAEKNKIPGLAVTDYHGKAQAPGRTPSPEEISQSALTLKQAAEHGNLLAIKLMQAIERAKRMQT